MFSLFVSNFSSPVSCISHFHLHTKLLCLRFSNVYNIFPLHFLLVLHFIAPSPAPFFLLKLMKATFYKVIQVYSVL